jgi:hypothetical protein
MVVRSAERNAEQPEDSTPMARGVDETVLTLPRPHPRPHIAQKKLE